MHDRHVVLASENAGGCYRVFKVALTQADWRFWVIATRIQNRCERPVRFDLGNGDDPWIGVYASSEGDVANFFALDPALSLPDFAGRKVPLRSAADSP